jgi:hypothetical protein
MKNYNRKEVNTNDDVYYYLNDKRHRTNGPAIEYNNGDKCWYVYGDRHNDKGPATIHKTGWTFWFLNDNLQTLSNSTPTWFLNDKPQTLSNTATTLKHQIFQYNINEKLR